jgi:hypothetical protein
MTNVRDVNFITGDAAKDKIAQLGNDDDADVRLVGFSPLLGMISTWQVRSGG